MGGSIILFCRQSALPLSYQGTSEGMLEVCNAIHHNTRTQNSVLYVLQRLCYNYLKRHDPPKYLQQTKSKEGSILEKPNGDYTYKIQRVS